MSRRATIVLPMVPSDTANLRYARLGSTMRVGSQQNAKLPAVANSNGAHLLWPYDMCTPADRAVIKVLEDTRWLLTCIRNDWRVE